MKHNDKFAEGPKELRMSKNLMQRNMRGCSGLPIHKVDYFPGGAGTLVIQLMQKRPKQQ